jgi:hypothetical protein
VGLTAGVPAADAEAEAVPAAHHQLHQQVQVQQLYQQVPTQRVSQPVHQQCRHLRKTAGDLVFSK